ncbi:unnamed protein product [Linum trigynum]|uniref:Uncharacterized protein n=1 Tax=Linum trigynum TaxID=586398 RepID=A0AAV2CCE0_9ROSI
MKPFNGQLILCTRPSHQVYFGSILPVDVVNLDHWVGVNGLLDDVEPRCCTPWPQTRLALKHLDQGEAVRADKAWQTEVSSQKGAL